MNCAIDRRHFDQEILHPTGPYQILDRFSAELVEVSDEDFDDLCLVHLCDWAEQVERSSIWDYRRTAIGELARRVGGIGESRYKTIIAKAPPQEWFEEYTFPPDACR